MKKSLIYFCLLGAAVVLSLALAGAGMAGVPLLVMALSLSIPFWLALVLPIYMLSGAAEGGRSG
ncbi:hypothetical protein ACIGHN_22920 [Acidovorax sp. NPDC077693]|uniref:hypothetical protein n=1 Tax=unclassified Acidovorax TaxID=2684926 RepID=UPI0037C77754